MLIRIVTKRLASSFRPQSGILSPTLRREVSLPTWQSFIALELQGVIPDNAKPTETGNSVAAHRFPKSRRISALPNCNVFRISKLRGPCCLLQNVLDNHGFRKSCGFLVDLISFLQRKSCRSTPPRMKNGMSETWGVRRKGDKG